MHIPRSLRNDARSNGSKVISQTLPLPQPDEFFADLLQCKSFRTLSQLEGLCAPIYTPSPFNGVMLLEVVMFSSKTLSNSNFKFRIVQHYFGHFIA